MYSFTLPLPPSANRLWRTFHGRTVLSDEARTFKQEAAWRAVEAGVEPLDGPVVVCMDVYFKARRGDLDNKAKAVLDSLNGVAWHDDGQVAELHMHRLLDRHAPRVEVTIYRQGEAQP